MNDNTNMFLDLLMIAAGGYLVYCAFLMKLKGEIGTSLISRNVDLSQAPDKAGYIRTMFLPNLIMGLFMILSGVSTSFLPKIGIGLPEKASTWIFLAALVLLVIYGIVSMNAQNKYLKPHA